MDEAETVLHETSVDNAASDDRVVNGSPVRVLIADDDPGIRAALERLISRDATLSFVGAATSAQEAIDLAASLHPDVVLLDVRMPEGGGTRAAAEIDELPDPPSTVAFSAYNDSAVIVSMLDAGACGYIVKGAATQDIVRTLWEASRMRQGPAAKAAPAYPPEEAMKVLIADAPGPARESLALLIESRPEFQLVGVAGSAADALRLSCMKRPRAVLIGRGLPDDATRAIREIRQGVPEARVLAFTAEQDPRGVRDALEAGASSYLVQSERDDEMLQALRDAAQGRTTLSPAAASAVVRELSVSSGTGREHRRGSRRQIQLKAYIRGEGLSVAFQPIVNLASGVAVGVEALARFDGGSREGPSVWFVEAEQAGVGHDLEMAAIRMALDTMAELPKDLFVAINASPRVAGSPEFAEALEGAPADRLIVEVTEHAAVEDYGALARTFRRLRERGLRIAVDDAGAGFASLRHVLMIEPDFLKLDISLCSGVVSDRRRRALARALLAFAQESGIYTIAEGVEREDDLSTLKELGADFGQGFLLGRPGPPERLIDSRTQT